MAKGGSVEQDKESVLLALSAQSELFLGVFNNVWRRKKAFARSVTAYQGMCQSNNCFYCQNNKNTSGMAAAIRVNTLLSL